MSEYSREEDRQQVMVVDALGAVYANNQLRLLTTDDKLYYSKGGVFTPINAGTATPTAHKASHQDGGSDEISVTGLSGLLADAQKVNVRKNSAGSVFTRQQLNFIEGSNVTLTVADDAGTPEVDITIAASSPAKTGARVSVSSNQSISDSSLTTIQFANELSDDGGYWESGSNTRLTAPATGHYLVYVIITWEANAAGNRLIKVVRNGAVDVDQINNASIPTHQATNNYSVWLELDATDYIEVQVYQTSGGALNVLATTSKFGIHRL